MPTLLTLRLAEPETPPYPVHLHAAACRLLEPPGVDHTAQRKPFTVGAPVAEDGTVTWRLGWLPDLELPAAWPPEELRLGGSSCRVIDARTRHQPFAALAASRPVTRGLVRFLTPTYFSRNGRDVPLPDPVLVMRSLAQRWNVFAPTGLDLDDTQCKALLSAVLLTNTDVHTVRVQVGRDSWQTGFIGDAELALTHTATPHVGAVFAALLRFATIAGIGAQTTYGFGEVHPEPLNGHTRSPYPNPEPPAENTTSPPLATV